MKKIYLLFLFISINSFSQINFDKGYFIDNSGTKIECLIRNIDWLNTPIEFEYKESENSEQKIITIKDVQEVGIYDNSKFIKANLNIDLSSNKLDDLSDNKEIIFEEKELFLKVLIEGEASLYEYVNGKIVKFFFKNNNTEIEQLIFKKYKSSQNQIGSNEEYKKQLWLNLKCDDITLKTFKYVDYKKNDLVDFFIKYNTCINKEFINYKKKNKQDLFNINLRVGLNNSSLSTGNTVSAHKSRYPDFDSQIGLRAGIEAEFVMPFNRNKWAFIIEPTYQSFNVKGDDSGKSVDYSSIELPIGVRHYMFINEKSKIFLNGSYIVDFSNGKALNLDIKTGGNLGFGVGYKRNDKLSLEFRYHTSRDLFYNFKTTYSNYNTMSLILGYTLF